MAVFWLLFLLSAVNVGLGYALAAYLGYAPPSLRDAWIALGAERTRPQSVDAAPVFPVSGRSTDFLGPQDPPAETTPLGPEALDSRIDHDRVEMPNATVECGGGAT